MAEKNKNKKEFKVDPKKEQELIAQYLANGGKVEVLEEVKEKKPTKAKISTEAHAALEKLLKSI